MLLSDVKFTYNKLLNAVQLKSPNKVKFTQKSYLAFISVALKVVSISKFTAQTQYSNQLENMKDTAQTLEADKMSDETVKEVLDKQFDELSAIGVKIVKFDLTTERLQQKAANLKRIGLKRQYIKSIKTKIRAIKDYNAKKRDIKNTMFENYATQKESISENYNDFARGLASGTMIDKFADPYSFTVKQEEPKQPEQIVNEITSQNLNAPAQQSIFSGVRTMPPAPAVNNQKPENLSNPGITSNNAGLDDAFSYPEKEKQGVSNLPSKGQVNNVNGDGKDIYSDVVVNSTEPSFRSVSGDEIRNMSPANLNRVRVVQKSTPEDLARIEAERQEAQRLQEEKLRKDSIVSGLLDGNMSITHVMPFLESGIVSAEDIKDRISSAQNLTPEQQKNAYGIQALLDYYEMMNPKENQDNVSPKIM